MKKLISALIFMFMSLAISAQKHPDRMFVVEKSGALRGFLVERIDSVYFKKVNGRYNVDITLHDFDSSDPEDPKIIVSFKRSKWCYYYRFTVMPKSEAKLYPTDADVAAYFDWKGGEMESKDYDHAEMSGFDFTFVPDAEYTILAMAYDGYGIACEASRVDFKYGFKLEGNPSVTYNIDEVGQQTATVSMTANDDCSEYYICIFPKGQAEQEFFKWSGMLGFTCMGDMIKQWSGKEHTGTYTHTWHDLVPATDYELYIQPCDINGHYGEMVIAPLSTEVMGGSGIAEVTIEIGEFGCQTDASGNKNYWQEVIFTPNDQCAAHRDMIITKEALDDGTWTEDRFIKYMKNEKNPQNADDPYWDIYGVDNAKFNVNPDTEYVAYTISKNAEGEWGPVAKKEFKTPASVQQPARMVRAQILQRINASRDVTLPGGKVIKKRIMIKE